MKNQRCIAILAIAGLLAGCVSPPPKVNEATGPSLEKARALYRAERYADAMIQCVELSREDPMMPGLAKLQSDLMKAITQERARNAAMLTPHTVPRMQVDIQENKVLPATYGIQRNVKGDDAPLRTTPTLMEAALRKKVTVHLDNVSLDDFILAIGASENINIIADPMSAASTMTVHAEDVPLREILDYVQRNMGIAFYVGENVIWVTAGQQGQPGVPMETRMYRLRKGLSSEEIAAGDDINIVAAVRRFIPDADGADLLFNQKAHVLIAKNTRSNLAKIEDIIETLDVVPPQILIEARFISTDISDLRELGIDWIMKSPWAISKKTTGAAGRHPDKSVRTRVEEDATLGFAPFPNVSEGLNLTYQGLLTDPMFQAVLHALEISGNATTLSVPKVTTVNNRAATMRVGEDFRYFEEYDVQSTPSDTTSDGNTVYSTILVPVGTPQVEELGIQLDVTPSVGSDMRSVTLNIVPEISEFVRFQTYEVAAQNNASNPQVTNQTSVVKLPIFRRSKIETELVVGSGETVAMGGLITSSESTTHRGVPIVSKIPLIGRLFRSETVDEVRKNLLIFVTATILSERGESLVPIAQSARAAAPE